MFEIDQGAGRPYRVPERRYAFFPRRMRSDEMPRDLQGVDRRNGKDRRKHDGAEEPAARDAR